MATKDQSFPVKNKHKLFVAALSSTNQYSNLNLNQHINHTFLDAVSPAATLKLPDSTVSDNYEERKGVKALNKLSGLCSNALKLNVKEKEKAEKQFKNDLNTKNSTLSLYIADFENSVGIVESVAPDKMQQRKNNNEIFPPSKTFIQNPFEFPRQQNYKVPEPEVTKYKASQKLINPNLGPVTKTRKKEASTPATTLTAEKGAKPNATNESAAEEATTSPVTEISAFPFQTGSNDREKLEAFIEYLRNKKEADVPFVAPAADYFTTSAKSIKFIITPDETWMLPVDAENVKLTYDASSQCQDLLITALFQFLDDGVLQQTIAINTLKLFGSDDFLEADEIIAKVFTVEKCVGNKEDVHLSIGIKTIKQINYKISNLLDLPQSANKLKQKRIVNEVLTQLETTVFSNHQKPIITQKVMDLSEACHGILTNDVSLALAALDDVDSVSKFEAVTKNIIAGVQSMLEMYFEAIHPNLEKEYFTPLNNVEMEIRDSIAVQSEFLVKLESIHNLPALWYQLYTSYYVEISLIYGMKNISLTFQTDIQNISTVFGNGSVYFQHMINTKWSIADLPRETYICFTVYGIKKGGNLKSKNATEILGCASLSLFDGNEFLTQGSDALIVNLQKPVNVEPWGPRQFIQMESETIIIFSTIKYCFKVKFPAVNANAIKPTNFSELNTNVQNKLLNLIDRSSTKEKEKSSETLIWSHRTALSQIPEAFITTLASVPSWKAKDLPEIYGLINKWNIPEIRHMLQLLLPSFPDNFLRKFAVKVLANGSSVFLNDCIPQFVEALRFETYEDSNLTKFLLERATKDRRFATFLYWELNHRIINERQPYSNRCEDVLLKLVSLKIPQFDEETVRVKYILQLLEDLSTKMKTGKSESNIKYGQIIFESINRKIESSKLRLPIIPAVLAVLASSMNTEICKVFNSKTKPAYLSINGCMNSTYGVIFKAGDDLRQDCMVLQLIRLMNDLWLRENLSLQILTYRVIPTGKNKGLIEAIGKCLPLQDIQTSLTGKTTDLLKTQSIMSWLTSKNSNEFHYRTSIDNFTCSCAGWCVATYVLGIGDRHNDNIMITESGQLFHIDFGKYLGDQQKAMGINRDRVPFVLTRDMAFVINDGKACDTEKWQQFCDLCCNAFQIIRENACFLLDIIELMSYSVYSNDAKPIFNQKVVDLSEICHGIFTCDVSSALAAFDFVFQSLLKKYYSCHSITKNLCLSVFFDL